MINPQRIACTLSLSLALGTVAMAQDPTGGWGLGYPHNKRYSPNAEISFSGKVVGVQRMPPRKGMSPAVMVLVRTPNGGTAMVELGPAWYVDNQPFKLKLKDRVSVTGSKAFEDSKSSILARKVIRTNKVAYLRGVDGFPMWVASRGHVAVMTAGQGGKAGGEVATGLAVIGGRIESLLDVTQEFGPPFRHVVLRTEAGTVEVNVGPSWFIERQDFSFIAGDPLVVTPFSDVQRPKPLAPLIIAAQLRRGDKVLVLRTPSGPPAWIGSGGG